MHLVFDFDGTITEKDTISDLANAGLDFQKIQQGYDLKATWDGVVNAYLDDCKQYKENYFPKEDDRRAVQDEVDFLGGLRTVESASLERVESSGLFAGLEPIGLFQMGVDAIESKKVAIREGFREIVELASQRGWTVGVISVNWSRSFIRGVLHQFDLHVIANEISNDGKIHGPDFLGRRLTNSAGKLEALRHEFAPNGEKTIYFGDSPTDLECLLKGGVVIADNDSCSLIQALRRIGFEAPHVDSHKDDSQGDIFWATNFRQVIDSGLLS